MSQLHLTLIISKLKGPSETLGDIQISVLQHIRFSELRKIQIARPNFTNEYVLDSFSWKNILKILWERGKIAPGEQFLLLPTIFCYLMLDFYV